MIYPKHEDTLFHEVEVLGKKQFEDKVMTFKDIESSFVNRSEREALLPHWFSHTDMKAQGFNQGEGKLGNEKQRQYDIDDVKGRGNEIVFQRKGDHPCSEECYKWVRESK